MLKNFALLVAVFAASANAVISVQIPAIDSADGCYTISSAEELFGFAQVANTRTGQDSDSEPLCGKLNSDIVLNDRVLNADGSLVSDSAALNQWIPIGQFSNDEQLPFQGIFDGQGHTVYGVYVNEPENLYAGFFGFLSTRGFNSSVGSVIKNLNFKDSYVGGNMSDGSTGGVIGRANLNLTIENVSFDGSVKGFNAGGLVGHIYSNANISIDNSFNLGAIAGAGYAGGLVGKASGPALSMVNCFNAGSVSGGNKVGGLVGYWGASPVLIANSFVAGSLSTTSAVDTAKAFLGYWRSYDKNDQQVLNSYYSDSLYSDLGTPTTAAAIANGALATVLHGYKNSVLWYNYASGNNTKLYVGGYIWGQDVAFENHPTLSGWIRGANVPTNKIVLALSDSTYAETSYIEGFEKVLPTLIDGKMISAWNVASDYSDSAVTSVPYSATGEKLFYGHVSALELDGDCYKIESVDQLFDFAALVNGGEAGACAVLAADLTVNGNSLSNVREWIPIGASEGTPFSGRFDGRGHVISGLFTQGADVAALYGSDVAALFGYVTATDNDVVIKNVGVENSYFKAEYAAGIAYFVETANEGTVTFENTFFVGTTESDNICGGIIGSATIDNTLRVSNSYSMEIGVNQNPLIGSVSSSYDLNLQLENVYYYAESQNSIYGVAVGKSAFANGTLAELFYQGSAEGSIWGQNVIAGDRYPNFSGRLIGTETVVSKITYHMDDSTVVEDFYTEGFGLELPEVMNGKFVYEWRTSKVLDEGEAVSLISVSTSGDLDFYERILPMDYVDGCFVINDAEGLREFANVVSNGSDSLVCGKLGRDIVYNRNVLDGNGALNAGKQYRYWTAIENFRGNFDGQGHVIYGLVTDAEHVYGGLFGFVSGDVTVKNLGLEDFYFFGHKSVGSFAAWVDGGNLTLENTYAIGTVKLENDGESYAVGRMVGTNNGAIKISNSYHMGKVVGIGFGNYNGFVGFGDSSLTVENSFFFDDSELGSASAADFENGVVAEQLHNGVNGTIWGQDVPGGDKYPNFSAQVIVAVLEKVVVDTLEIEDRAPSVEFVDGCYEIKDADALFEFAEIVNGGESSACGKLTNDIVINENLLNSEGFLNGDSSDFIQWIPIGNSYETPFNGILDGQGHTVSGLYVEGNGNFAGLIGAIGGASVNVSVKNIGVKDSYLNAYYAGGVIAFVDMRELSGIRIENVFSVSSVSGAGHVGSLIGSASGDEETVSYVMILNSYGVGLHYSAVALCGKTSGNVYAMNSYYLDGKASSLGIAAPAADFANGSIAATLNSYGDYEVDGSIWNKTVAEDESYPSFGKVTVLVEDDGCYAISDVDDLYAFARKVNGGESNACGKLTADIVVNEDVLDENGQLKNEISSYRLWKPIGTANFSTKSYQLFEGVFDGQGHTISGLVSDGSSSFEGLFGAVSSEEGTTVIRNVGVVNSYIRGNYAGGICGLVFGTSVIIENVFAMATVQAVDGESLAGGIVAMFDSEENSRLVNSYFVGSVSGVYSASIAVQVSSAVKVDNNFFVGESNDAYGIAKSAAAFADGTVAELLHDYNANDVDGSIWGQNLPLGDEYPNFSGVVVKNTLVIAMD